MWQRPGTETLRLGNLSCRHLTGGLQTSPHTPNPCSAGARRHTIFTEDLQGLLRLGLKKLTGLEPVLADVDAFFKGTTCGKRRIATCT